ncbi:Putative Per a allergen [Gryllus bimaculatus]|nr:Putative Per a allergen [Gryllus bimaculatus]
MAPKYKLTYFNIRALAEPIRFLFAYGNIEYEDIRIERENWPKVKSSYPAGKLPILEVDGKIVVQSSAICRYLAKQVGLAGANDWEALEIDSVVDTITDVRLQIVYYAFEEDKAAKAKKKETLEKETLPAYLSRLESIAKENGGYFVGGKLTWADLYLAAIHETFTHFLEGNPLDSYPSLQGVVDKVYALPAIKDWIAKRPKTDI